jgi:hypothetical protein
MNAELISGFEKELSDLMESIASARTEVETLEDAEECALSRHKIAALETLLAVVSKSRDVVILGEIEAEDGLKKFRRWHEAVALARDATLALEPFEIVIPNAQAQVDAAENNFSNAQAALADHLNHPIAELNFVAQSKIKALAKRKAELETVMQDRSAQLRSLKQSLDGLRGSLLKARDAANAAMFRERMSRLPQPQRQEGFGTVTAVS